MRGSKIRTLYYPDMFVSETTLKKAILLFDELHFIDRPSFTFNNFGSIGATSPIRPYEASFREAGVPIYVHGIAGGRLEGDFLEQTLSDIDDLEFLIRFQSGIKSSKTFKDILVPQGNYGEGRNADDVANKLSNVDIAVVLENYGSAHELFYDDKVKPFDLSTPLGCAKQLLSTAALCAANLNFALAEGARNDFIPLADAVPYGELLGAKYRRAVNKIQLAKNPLQITDLSFAIFDQVVSAESIEEMSIKDVVAHRKSSQKAREEFLEHMGSLRDRQGSIDVGSDYAGEIDKIIKSEILPAAHDFRNKLEAIDNSFKSALAKGTVGFLGSSGALVSIFADLSWPRLIGLAGGAAAYVGNAAIDTFVAKRAVKRECSISYLLSLDKK